MKVKLFFSMLLIATMPCIWTACSDNDNNGDVVENDDNDDVITMTQENIADIAADNFIRHVCDVEIDSSTFRAKSWELSYGRVLYPATPDVRYDRAESQDAARQKFLSMISSVATIDSSSIAGVMKVDMGSHGSVQYTPVNQNGEWARIEVNLKELPDLRTIVFNKPEAWPLNATDCGVKRGTVFSRIETDEHNNNIQHLVYYICVKECGMDGTGYLIGFDTWSVDPLDHSGNHTYDGYECYDACWNKLAGGASVIECLRGFLYYNDGTKYDKAEGIIRKIGEMQGGADKNKDFCGDEPLYNFLYSAGPFAGKNPFFKTGNDDYYVDTVTKKKKGTYHFARPPYTRMTPTSVQSTTIIYNCYQVSPTQSYPKKMNRVTHDAGRDEGQSWAISQYGAEWVWNTGKWFCFQRPFIIEFKDTDAANLPDFRTLYGLTQINID